MIKRYTAEMARKDVKAPWLKVLRVSYARIQEAALSGLCAVELECASAWLNKLEKELEKAGFVVSCFFDDRINVNWDAPRSTEDTP